MDDIAGLAENCLEILARGPNPAFSGSAAYYLRSLAKRLQDRGYVLRSETKVKESFFQKLLSCSHRPDVVLSVGELPGIFVEGAGELLSREVIRLTAASELPHILRTRRPRSILALIDERDYESVEILVKSKAAVGFVLGDSYERLAARLAKILLCRSVQSVNLRDAVVIPDRSEPQVFESDLLDLYDGQVNITDLRKVLTDGRRILGLLMHADGYSGHLISGALCSRIGEVSSAIPLSCHTDEFCSRLGIKYDTEQFSGQLVPAAALRCELLANLTCCGIRLRGPLGGAGTLGQRLMDNPDVGQMLTTIGLIQASPHTIKSVLCGLYAGLDLGTLTQCLNSEAASISAHSWFYILIGDPLWTLPRHERNSSGEAEWHIRLIDSGAEQGAIATVDEDDYKLHDFGNPVLPRGAFLRRGKETFLCTALPETLSIQSISTLDASKQHSKLESIILRLEFLTRLLASARTAGFEEDDQLNAGGQLITDALEATRWTLHDVAQLPNILIAKDDYDAMLATVVSIVNALGEPIIEGLTNFVRRHGGIISHLWGDDFRSIPEAIKSIECPHCGAPASSQIRTGWVNHRQQRRLIKCIDCAVIFDGPADVSFHLELSHMDIAAGDRLSLRLTSDGDTIDYAVALLETTPRQKGQTFELISHAGDTLDFQIVVSEICPPGNANVTVLVLASGALALLGPRILIRPAKRPPGEMNLS